MPSHSKTEWLYYLDNKNVRKMDIFTQPLKNKPKTLWSSESPVSHSTTAVPKDAWAWLKFQFGSIILYPARKHQEKSEKNGEDLKAIHSVCLRIG